MSADTEWADFVGQVASIAGVGPEAIVSDAPVVESRVLDSLAISELWKSAPLWASLLLGNILSVALLTWAVMPVVTRALRFWLAPGTGAAHPRTDLLGVLASWAFLAAAALVFWLVTVRLWTLP